MTIKIKVTPSFIRITIKSQIGKDVLEYLPPNVDREGFLVNVRGKAFWFHSEKAAMGFLTLVIKKFLQSHNS